MKPLLASLAIALLGAGVAACGGASKETGSTAASSSHAAATGAAAASTTASTQDYTKADSDKDNDVGAVKDDSNNNRELDYGHAASAADARAVTALVKRYYAAAAAQDGTQACTMLAASLEESAVEDYGHGSDGPSYLSSGTNCPAVMRLLFEHFHSQLTTELPLLQVSRVRLVGHRGAAILTFGSMPEREIAVDREGHTWKIDALLDQELS